MGVLEALEVTTNSMGISIDTLLGKSIIFTHGTTIATNTIINRDGAKTGLITTKGFEDTILIMRAIGRIAGLSEIERKHISRSRKPEPVIPRFLIKGVNERIDYKGRVLIPLDIENVKKSINSLIEGGVEAIAVSLLWSFVNPFHEREIKKIINETYPGIYVTLSSELIPVIGEYERTATTVLNSYIGPKSYRYFLSLKDKLKEKGFKLSPLIMQSYGGSIPIESASEQPISTLSSGPVGGVIGSKYIGALLGYKNIITTDMGGTSFDVGIIYEEVPEQAYRPAINQYNILTPMVEIKSIGAGGGSIAWIEKESGILKVGPFSAGSLPGPVCYDKGGKAPTLTDADLILGYINPDYFLGGRIKLNKENAYRTIKERIADPLKMDIIEASFGIYEIINAQMADLIRSVTVNRGYDPKNFVLFSYGGAGPLHAGGFGKDLGVKEIIIPFTAAVHSAYGILSTDIVHTYEFSDYIPIPVDTERINRNFNKLNEEADRNLRKEGFKYDDVEIRYYLDMRYRRQVHEVRCPVPAKILNDDDMEGVINTFETLYERLYGKGAGFKEAGIDIINFIVVGSGKIVHPDLEELELRDVEPSKALKAKREVFLKDKGGFMRTDIYDFEKLEPGNILYGPAIIESPITTILINIGDKGIVDRYKNVIIKGD
jgi:N-methylhydantoinase A